MLLAQPGIGPVTAAQVLISWSHPGRLRSEAAFAMLAGAAPVEASSGQVVRHRLNRGGDRQLNRALHTIVMSRQRYHQPTKTYTTRRIAQGKSERESAGASSAPSPASCSGCWSARWDAWPLPDSSPCHHPLTTIEASPWPRRHRPEGGPGGGPSPGLLATRLAGEAVVLAGRAARRSRANVRHPATAQLHTAQPIRP